ncbi:hypothetical protein [Vibrio alginolyticus]|uniref:hypothetical protein n=1 Tax=Vibrio alginolyticus TaxID=663 RepID=UPI002160443D|nr:hypothetical protein [Vibrio alginolyticus]MCS0289424.1 hypothetical protein [Vibrio alginolyticus]
MTLISSIFGLVGMLFFFLGIFSKPTVKEKIGDFWTALADVRWGQLIHKDAMIFSSIVSKAFGKPTSIRFYVNAITLSIVLNALFLSLYSVIDFNTRVNVSGNELLLLLNGIVAPGVVLDTLSFVTTFIVLHAVSRFARGRLLNDLFVYVSFLIIDVFIVILCVSSASYIYEIMQLSVGKLRFEYFDAPDFNKLLFLSLLYDSIYMFFQAPFDFFTMNLEGYLYIGGKYGAPFWPIILCIITTAIPTILHILLLLLFTMLKLFQSILKPITMYLAEKLYLFGSTKLARNLEWWGGAFMAVSTGLAAYGVLVKG